MVGGGEMIDHECDDEARKKGTCTKRDSPAGGTNLESLRVLR